jgi:hypothetical protein
VGNIRFGFRLSPDGKHVEPDPGEQNVLTEIRRQNGHTLRGIAAALNREALRTRRALLSLLTFPRLSTVELIPEAGKWQKR